MKYEKGATAAAEGMSLKIEFLRPVVSTCTLVKSNDEAGVDVTVWSTQPYILIFTSATEIIPYGLYCKQIEESRTFIT